MRIFVNQLLAARGAGHRRLGYDHCTTIPGPTTAALSGRLEGEVHLLERVRTTLLAGPRAAAARVPVLTGDGMASPKCSVRTNFSLPILGRTREGMTPATVRPVHLQRPKLSVNPEASIQSHGADAHIPAHNAEEAQDKHSRSSIPAASHEACAFTVAASDTCRPHCQPAPVEDFADTCRTEISQNEESTQDEHEVADPMGLTTSWSFSVVGRSRLRRANRARLYLHGAQHEPETAGAATFNRTHIAADATCMTRDACFVIVTTLPGFTFYARLSVGLCPWTPSNPYIYCPSDLPCLLLRLWHVAVSL